MKAICSEVPYVAKVKEMGIENVIGIYQEALDAWNS